MELTAMELITQGLMAAGDILIGFTYFILMYITIYAVAFCVQKLMTLIMGS